MEEHRPGKCREISGKHPEIFPKLQPIFDGAKVFQAKNILAALCNFQFYFYLKNCIYPKKLRKFGKPTLEGASENAIGRMLFRKLFLVCNFLFMPKQYLKPRL